MSGELKFHYDDYTDVLTIEGIRYSGDLFRALGFGPIGSVVRLEAREDGVVTLTRLRLYEAVEIERSMTPDNAEAKST